MAEDASHVVQGDLLEGLGELSDDAVRRIMAEHRDVDRDLQFEFERFHRAHPEVYKILVWLAREAKTKGVTRIGMKALWERMRWEFTVGEQSGKEWKLNNNHTSRYARLIMEREPELAELFETRQLRS